MREPYRPFVDVSGLESEPAFAQGKVNACHDYYDKQGITQELVREPLPLGGGYGFRWAFYQHGKEIKRP